MRLVLILMLAVASLGASATTLAEQKATEMAADCERYADRFNADWDFTLRSSHVKKCLINKRIAVLRLTKTALEAVPAGSGAAYVRARMRTAVIESIIERLREQHAGLQGFTSLVKLKAALAADIGEYYQVM